MLGVHPTQYGWTAERSTVSAAYRAWVAALWDTRRRRWHHRLAPWTRRWLADALCIHHYEGAWNDPEAPYWGGLQMDRAFMAAYGGSFYLRLGTADHWPPVLQLHAAYRAWQRRGFEPWPETAARCGL